MNEDRQKCRISWCDHEVEWHNSGLCEDHMNHGIVGAPFARARRHLTEKWGAWARLLFGNWADGCTLVLAVIMAICLLSLVSLLIFAIQNLL